MTSLEFKSPGTLAEACELLAMPGSKALAGGTDVIPQMRDGRFRAGVLVDLSRIDGLSGIELAGGEVVIGALTRYSDMLHSSLLLAHAPFLAEVSGLVGGAQTQNRGTLGGNIANASPAGDTLPVLLALDAVVDLIGRDGERTLPLADFLLGPGQTALAPGELLRRVRFAPLGPGVRSRFLRLGNRRGMLISVVSAAVALGRDEYGRVSDCRVALGAVAPTPVRCRKAEMLLLGRRPDAELIDRAAAAALAACRPIDDVRASAGYRRHGVRVLVRRGLMELVAQPFPAAGV